MRSSPQSLPTFDAPRLTNRFPSNRIIAAIILRLHSLSVESDSDDPTFSGVFFIIWSIIEVAYGIYSGNIACLKPFVAAFNTSYGGSVEINALERGSREGSYSGTLKTMSSVMYPRRKTARSQRKELTNGSTNITASSTAGEVHDMDQTGAGTPIDRHPDKARQMNKLNNIDKERGNPLADAGIGAKYSNNVEVSHEDADSTLSYGSRQMIIHRELGWSVTSADESR